MTNRLLAMLLLFIAVGTVVLFWALDVLSNHAEQRMSFIDETYQQQLTVYASQAEALFKAGDQASLDTWLSALQHKENTWAAVVQSEVMPMGKSTLSPQFLEGFRLGRNVEWKIHLYFKENPIMDIPFDDGVTRFLIQLPQRMRPGDFFPYTDIVLKIALPFLLLSILTLIVYRYVMNPLKKLERATRRFSEGQFDARVKPALGERSDEIAAIASVFDQMAERVSKLIDGQRQLLSDLSHELRTPLTRMDLAIEFVSEGVEQQAAIERLRYESSTMRDLVEDALTLAWLNTETPSLTNESVDLSTLLQVICDDAAFEHPSRKLVLNIADDIELAGSNQQALGAAFENIIRNALKYTPQAGAVVVSAKVVNQHSIEIAVSDEGQGVPESQLENIFRPFFRIDQSRQRRPDHFSGKRPGGFGLGLALAERQVVAAGGKISAFNIRTNDGSAGNVKGLCICITLPLDSAKHSLRVAETAVV